jgi:hypothetical protein
MRKVKSIQVGFDLRSINPCKVTIWYEDASAHARALEVCQDVAQQFDPQLNFEFTSWRLRELNEPKPARLAIRDAANSDIVLISTSGATLPPKIRECLEACAKGRTKSEGALAWLMTAPPDGSVSTELLSSELRQTASRLGMDFLPPGVFRISPLVIDSPAPLSFTPISASKDSDSAGYFHWGLNE